MVYNRTTVNAVVSVKKYLQHALLARIYNRLKLFADRWQYLLDSFLDQRRTYCWGNRGGRLG